MKKFALVFAFSATFLTACSSNDYDENVDPNELTPGIMQPVAGSGANEGGFGWEPSFQPVEMPSTMQ